MPAAGSEKFKNREEYLHHVRTRLVELDTRFGLALGNEERSATLTAEARRLQLPQRLLNNQTSVIPCRAELEEIGIADPCLIVPATWPIELLPPHKQIAVGGQVKSISRSPYSLPRYVMDAAWRSRAVWQGSLMPVEVMIDNERTFLVRANSWFFRCGKFQGHDIDASYTNEPNERDLKRGNYTWGDDMSHEITVVVARF